MMSVKHFITRAGMLELSMCEWNPVYNIHGRGGLGYHQHSIIGGRIMGRGPPTVTQTITAPAIAATAQQQSTPAGLSWLDNINTVSAAPTTLQAIEASRAADDKKFKELQNLHVLEKEKEDKKMINDEDRIADLYMKQIADKDGKNAKEYIDLPTDSPAKRQIAKAINKKGAIGIRL